MPRGSYRHPLPVRITHWLNLLFLLAMLGSGLQIFNAHPALYWGSRSDQGAAWLSLEAGFDPFTGEPVGITRLFGAELRTTGLLGFSSDTPRGFPAWATIPGDQWLAMGRRWHLFFAWLLVANCVAFIVWAAISRHLSRILLPGRTALRNLGPTLVHHFHLRLLRQDSDRGYNALQQLSYLGVIFVLAPMILITGLAMSPRVDAALHWLPELFGGRQSARSIHFLVASTFVIFTVVHVFMVVLVGPVRYTRSMITGWLMPPKGPQ
jgi:thiosulfate reductase cytochrome b subunit